MCRLLMPQGNSPKPRTNAGESKSRVREIQQPDRWYLSAVFNNSSISSTGESASFDSEQNSIRLLFMDVVLSNILPPLLGLVFMSNQPRFDCCLLRGFESTEGRKFPSSSTRFLLYVARPGTSMIENFSRICIAYSRKE